MESFAVLLPLFDLAGICFIVSHAETILDLDRLCIPVTQVQHFACVRVLYFLGVKDTVETRLSMVMVNFRLHARLLAYCVTVIPLAMEILEQTVLLLPQAKSFSLGFGGLVLLL